MRTSTTFSSSMEISEKTTSRTSFSPQPIVVENSPWHSPMPYLFGGLAAMLGLIAFALLILACSYWKLYRDLNNGQRIERDFEVASGSGSGNGVKLDGDSMAKGALDSDQGLFLVIMAGDFKPTCLATPVISSVSLSSIKKEDEAKVKDDFSEIPKEEA